VVERGAERLAREEGVTIAGVAAPRIGLAAGSDEDALVARIAATRPDLIVTCLGAPKGELWIDRVRDRLRPAVAILNGTRLSPNPAHDSVQIWARTQIVGAQVRVKVYSIAGELIAKLDFNGADVQTWNLTNTAGERLASGVYLVVILASDPQSGLTERQILKLAVIR
jgi:hypothetical protein